MIKLVLKEFKTTYLYSKDLRKMLDVEHYEVLESYFQVYDDGKPKGLLKLFSSPSGNNPFSLTPLIYTTCSEESDDWNMYDEEGYTSFIGGILLSDILAELQDIVDRR